MTKLIDILLDLWWFFRGIHAPAYQQEEHNLAAIERWLETEYFSYSDNDKKFTFKKR